MKTRKPLILLALIAMTAVALPGCYEKVVRDDSVASRLGRATGQPKPPAEPVKEKSSWWPW